MDQLKVDDHVLVYGYAKNLKTDKMKYEIGLGPGEWVGFFNGVEMQILSLDTQYGCDTAVLREFDLNQGTIKTFTCHQGQLRKIK